MQSVQSCKTLNALYIQSYASSASDSGFVMQMYMPSTAVLPLMLSHCSAKSSAGSSTNSSASIRYDGRGEGSVRLYVCASWQVSRGQVLTISASVCALSVKHTMMLLIGKASTCICSTMHASACKMRCNGWWYVQGLQHLFNTGRLASGDTFASWFNLSTAVHTFVTRSDWLHRQSWLHTGHTMRWH